MTYADDAGMRVALRKEFPAEQIGKLPATQKRPALDYIGHAAVTDRLNHAAPDWTYDVTPVEVRGRLERVDGKSTFVTDPDGFPHVVAVFGSITVGGVTRQEVGEVDSFSTYGREMKEAISDFIRRGAMRFGVALDLWTKEDLQASAQLEPAGEERRTGPDRMGDGGGPAVSAQDDTGGDTDGPNRGESAADGEAAAGSPRSSGDAVVAAAVPPDTDPSAAPSRTDGDESGSSSAAPGPLSSQARQLLRHAADLRWGDQDIAAAVEEAYPGLVSGSDGATPPLLLLDQEQARELLRVWQGYVRDSRVTKEQKAALKPLASPTDLVKAAQVLFGADRIRGLNDLTRDEADRLIGSLRKVREEQAVAS